MVKLTAEQQELFGHLEPQAFVPAKGAWGRGGATNVKLGTASKSLVRKALLEAWGNTAPKSLVRKSDRPRGS